MIRPPVKFTVRHVGRSTIQEMTMDTTDKPTVRVKPLVWMQNTTWPDSYDADICVGRYTVGQYNKGAFSCHVEPMMRDIGLNFRSVHDAMKAGQADYEARIVAALEPAHIPAPTLADLLAVPEVAALVEQAKIMLNCYDAWARCVSGSPEDHIALAAMHSRTFRLHAALAHFTAAQGEKA